MHLQGIPDRRPGKLWHDSVPASHHCDVSLVPPNLNELVMARKRQTDKNESQNTSDLQISEEEQWRLIEQSGVLKKVLTSDHEPTSSSTPPQARQGSDDEDEYPLAEELFAAATLLIPISFLLLLMYM